MLDIRSEDSGDEVKIYPDGKLDTNSSQQLTDEIKRYTDSGRKVVIDFEKIEYISSAGLRVLVLADQELNKNGGELSVTHVSDHIMDIFEMTGFDNMLTIV
jgi:anti-sigma B factor antagonist